VAPPRFGGTAESARESNPFHTEELIGQRISSGLQKTSAFAQGEGIRSSRSHPSFGLYCMAREAVFGAGWPSPRARARLQRSGARARNCVSQHAASSRCSGPYRLIITTQCGQPFVWRDQAKRARLGLDVVCPRTAKELALPGHDPIAKVMLVNGLARGWIICKRRRIRIMAGEPVRGRLVGGPKVFGVEDCCLLPEASFHFQGHDIALPVRKRIG
jgi:hypothetical protein